MNRRRVLNIVLLVVGLIGIAWATSKTVSDAQEQVFPSVAALCVAAVFAFGTITASARAWVALFRDVVESRASRATLRGTFYLSQLTKYLPAGGVVQAASQVGLARAIGVPLKRVAVAFPVSVVGAVAASGTLASALVFDTNLDNWVRLLALAGLLSVVLLHRGLMGRVLQLAHRFVHRIPESDQLPTQTDILMFYAWALVTVGSLCLGYTILLRSVAPGVSSWVVVSAFAASWVVGFLAVPIPAGVGIREAMLVALVPNVGAAPVLAASLALRLLSIGAEVVTFFVNKLVVRRHAGVTFVEETVEELNFP
jgi:hypothetical protein